MGRIIYEFPSRTSDKCFFYIYIKRGHWGMDVGNTSLVIQGAVGTGSWSGQRLEVGLLVRGWLSRLKEAR